MPLLFWANPSALLAPEPRPMLFKAKKEKLSLNSSSKAIESPCPGSPSCVLPSFLEPWRSSLIEKRRRNLHNLIKSCYTARTILPEETGVFYAHFQKTAQLEGKLVTLIDNLGIANQIPINETLFVLQEKANLFLKDLNPGRVASMIELTFRQCQKGIANTDMVFSRNFGFKRREGRQPRYRLLLVQTPGSKNRVNSKKNFLSNFSLYVIYLKRLILNFWKHLMIKLRLFSALKISVCLAAAYLVYHGDKKRHPRLHRHRDRSEYSFVGYPLPHFPGSVPAPCPTLLLFWRRRSILMFF